MSVNASKVKCTLAIVLKYTAPKRVWFVPTSKLITSSLRRCLYIAVKKRVLNDVSIIRAISNGLTQSESKKAFDMTTLYDTAIMNKISIIRKHHQDTSV